MQLNATIDAPARARAALAEAIGEDPRGDVVALAASELVTNAIMHGERRGERDEEIELRVDTTPDGMLRVEVRNRALTPFALADVETPAADQPGGWGLGIVEAVSADWGVDRVDGCTLAWFVV